MERHFRGRVNIIFIIYDCLEEKEVVDHAKRLTKEGHTVCAPFCDDPECNSPECFIKMMELISRADECHVYLTDRSDRVIRGLEIATMMGKKMIRIV